MNANSFPLEMTNQKYEGKGNGRGINTTPCKNHMGLLIFFNL